MSYQRIRSIFLPALAMTLLMGAQSATAIDVFFEDFQGEVMPVGWALFDEDGNTPFSNVAQFTEAWIVMNEDFASSANFVAASNSWYGPVGQSDDYMITPQISLGSSDNLSWLAQSADVNFPEAYEVRISTTTQDPAGCLANLPLFEVAVEVTPFVSHTVSLETYANQSVYICFRNVSDDMFVIQIDDVLVQRVASFDANVSNPLMPSEYGRIPTFLGLPIQLGATIENNGSDTITNVVLTATIEENGVPLTPVSSSPIASLAQGTDPMDISFPSHTALTTGTLEITYEVTIDETDADPANNSVTADPIIVVTEREMGRDDNLVSVALGVGPDFDAELGTLFRTGQANTIASVFFSINGSAELSGTDIVVNLRSFDNMAGIPGAVIATSNPFTVPDDQPANISVTFPGGPVAVPADFFVGVVEGMPSNITLQASGTGSIVPGTNFAIFGTEPWTPIEDLGFFINFVIRPSFVPAGNDTFSDGFESGDTAVWSSAVPAP